MGDIIYGTGVILLLIQWLHPLGYLFFESILSKQKKIVYPLLGIFFTVSFISTLLVYYYHNQNIQYYYCLGGWNCFVN